MDIPTELVAQFCGVTNADETLASQLLRDSGLDLEAAIQSFFAIQEAGGLPSDSSDTLDAPPAPPPPPPERRVRPPIPQLVDTLLPAPPQRVANQHETHNRSDPFAHTDGTRRGDGLAALFRPPTHLSFSGSFEDAMTAGQSQNRWILVNVQRVDVFASHTMNRDVWSDPSVEELLQSHFVFWQRDETQADGARYKHFYRYTQAPHVAIIDPRSGERVRVWGGDGEPIPKNVLMSELVDFVTTNSLENSASVPPAIRPGQPSSRSTITRPLPRTGAPSTAGTSSGVAAPSSDDMDDIGRADAALAAAIAASMEDTDDANEASGENGHGYPAAPAGDVHRQTSRLLSATDPELNSRRSLRAEQDDAYEESLAMDRAKEESQKEEARRVENAAEEENRRARQAAEMREQKRRRIPPLPPSSTTEKVTELAIRLPNGQRLQRRFFASHTMGSVYDYIESECEELSQTNFELMQAYPKKSYADRDVPLTELAPKAALVVHLKD